MAFNWTVFGAGVALASAASVAVAISVYGQDKQRKLEYERPADERQLSAGAPTLIWLLGQQLFFDTRLSGSSTMNCASCHRPDQSWSDHLSKPIGDANKSLARRAPTLLNAGQTEIYGWTGRFHNAAEVSMFASGSAGVMNGPIAEVIARLEADPKYKEEFGAAFSDRAISRENIGSALSSFVRSITSDEAPFDRWVRGDTSALSSSAGRGFAVFNGKGHCAECHKGWAFTDGSFHDIGVGTGEDRGRGKIFKTSVKLQYAFKTPTLRNVAERAPYMHDGSLKTIDEVVDHYDKGGIDRPSRAEGIEPLKLTSSEKADLVEFLRTLTSGTKFVDRRDAS